MVLLDHPDACACGPCLAPLRRAADEVTDEELDDLMEMAAIKFRTNRDRVAYRRRLERILRRLRQLTQR